VPNQDSIKNLRFLERRVMCGMLQPKEAFHRGFNLPEVLGGQNGGYVLIVTPEDKEHRHLEPGDFADQAKPRKFRPQMAERELISTTELHEVPEVRLGFA
jgi:hypothetical protein